jgi:hypothetical protein
MSLPGNANRVSSLPAILSLAILSIPSMRERRASIRLAACWKICPNKSIVFQAAENRIKIWLRFGGRYFWQRSDPRWWCVMKWEAHEG